jgi:hypothetical protein
MVTIGRVDAIKRRSKTIGYISGSIKVIKCVIDPEPFHQFRFRTGGHHGMGRQDQQDQSDLKPGDSFQDEPVNG